MPKSVSHPPSQPTHDPETRIQVSRGGVIGAVALLILSLIFVIGGLKLGLGSPFRLGTGAFPFASGAILAVLSIFVGLQELRNPTMEDAPDWTSFLAIAAAIAAFAASADRVGLVPAAFLAVVIASAPDRTLPIGGKVLLGGIVSISCWVLFIELLNLPFKAVVGL